SLAGKKLFRPLNDHATGNFSVASSFAHGNSSVDRPFGIFIVIRFSCRRNPTVTWRTPSSRRRGKPCETFFPPSEQKKGEIPPFLVLASVAHALLILFALVDIGLVLDIGAGEVMLPGPVLSRHVKEIIMF